MRVLPFRTWTLLVATFVLGSCGPRAGYGVLLWAPVENGEGTQQATTSAPALGANGAIVALERESKMQNVYWVRPPKERQLAEVPVWRFRAFERKNEAEQYAERYAPLAHVYAYSLRRGLPVREAPRQDTRIVYKLDANQVVKVVWRAERPQKTGAYTNTWFRVLTSDGFDGYCFGQYLKLFQTRSDPYAEAKVLQAKDENLLRILAEVWRPEYFREMIEKKRIDLRRFRDDVGLFPDPQAKSVLIQKATVTHQFSYLEVRKLSASTYQFEGSELRVELLGEDRLVATYSTPERLVSEVYLAIEDDIEEIIDTERERRQDIYKAFVGSTKHSGAYGTIEFGPDMSFTWKGYERLVPSVVPPAAGERGRVDFHYHLDADAVRRFDGVMTFRFSALPADREVNFFYKLEGSALRMVFATARGIDELLMRTSGTSSWVLFFE